MFDIKLRSISIYLSMFVIFDLIEMFDPFDIHVFHFLTPWVSQYVKNDFGHLTSIGHDSWELKQLNFPFPLLMIFVFPEIVFEFLNLDENCFHFGYSVTLLT